MRFFDYFKPETLAEASEHLHKMGDDGAILNGGTDLIIRMRDDISNPKAVVDLKCIDGLKKLYEKDGVFVIGSCATMNEVTENDFVSENIRVLAEACHSVGSYSVRNRATIAGNICNASPLADSATPLLALDAAVEIFSTDGTKEVSIHDFFTGVRKNCLKTGEIVTAIKIPLHKEPVNGGFFKQSRRSEVDLSTVCASVVCAGGQIKIAYGSVAPTPMRARKTEEFLNGADIFKPENTSKLDEIIKKAQDIAVTEVSPIDDIRASREYRLEIVRVLLKRGIMKILGKEEE